MNSGSVLARPENTHSRVARRVALVGFSMAICVLVILLGLLVGFAGTAAAQESAEEPVMKQSCPYFALPDNAAADWSTCASCHERETLHHAASAHGLPASKELPFGVEGPRLTQTCGDCHRPQRTDSEVGTSFDFELTRCETCHTTEAELLQTDVHAEQPELACTDCHDAHTIARGPVEAEVVGERCTQCHLAAAQAVGASPHGERQDNGYRGALCSDCHDPHAVRLPEDDRTAAVAAVETCTNCHEGNVAESYAFSFHGTALRLGEESVATCTDCHGYHGIETFRASEAAVLPVGTRLAQTCGQSGCHTGTGVRELPDDYQEHVLPQKSAAFPVHFTWNFFIVLILFDTIKDGPIVILELLRTLLNDLRARLARRKRGELA